MYACALKLTALHPSQVQSWMPYLLMSTGRAAGAEAVAEVDAASAEEAFCSALLPPLSGCSMAGVDMAAEQINHKG